MGTPPVHRHSIASRWGCPLLTEFTAVFMSPIVPLALLISAISVGATIKPEGFFLLGLATMVFATVGLLAVWRLVSGRKG